MLRNTSPIEPRPWTPNPNPDPWIAGGKGAPASKRKKGSTFNRPGPKVPKRKPTAPKVAAKVAEKELGWFGRTMKTVGPGLGKAMNLWFAWDMARAAGYMGGEQSRGRDFMSAMGALQPEWKQSIESAGRMQDMRNQVGGMEDLARFAKGKDFTSHSMMQSMESELDQLIGNKAAVLSQASLLPPTTQALLSGAVQTGAL